MPAFPCENISCCCVLLVTGKYLKDYPNLSKMNKLINKNASIDGKLYGIYRERPLSRQGIVIRKDWLDNLGLDMPFPSIEAFLLISLFILLKFG